MSPVARPAPTDRSLRALDGPDLIRAAQTGDRRAIDRLLRIHQPAVEAVCRRITRNDADALDATQDALIAIVRGLPRFDGRSKFSTWVYRVATNACLDELRRRRRRPQVGLPEVDGAPAEPVGPAEDLADAVADRLRMDAALAELPEGYRAVLVLRELCQFDYAEIAATLGVPQGTVRSRLSRARAWLADHGAEGLDGSAPLRRAS